MIDIRISHYFQLQFIALGIGLVVGTGLLIWHANYLLAPVFFVFGIIFLTTNNRLRIDLENNTFREYVWFLGFQLGKIKALPKPTHVVINPTTTEIKYGDIDYGRINTNQRRATAYLKFEQNESVYLGDARNSKVLTEKLAELTNALNIPVNNNVN